MNAETQLTVLNKVVERMTDCYLPTGDVDPQSLAPLLTNADATAKDHEDLMADYYLDNDQEMVRILGLQEVHEYQVVLPGVMHFYIRGWTVHIDRMQVIAGNLSAKAEIEEVEDWVDHLVMTRKSQNSRISTLDTWVCAMAPTPLGVVLSKTPVRPVV